MKKPYVIAIAMSAVIVVWMASGLLRSPKENSVKTPAEQSGQRMLVQVQTQIAQSVKLKLTVQGDVEPNREVTIRSDIAGRINELLAKEGQRLDAGVVLMRLDTQDRQIRLAREKALLQSRQKAYQRVQALAKENFQSESAIEEAFAALKSAEASVAQIELEISQLSIKAPFAGVIDASMVEEGGYVAANAEIARFVDNNPLVVVVPVAQQNVQQIESGTEALVRFATGEEKTGRLRYISPLANANTRTFRAEIEVENPDHLIPAGISAEVEIPTSEVTGHFVSPAILSLDESGVIGVKTVTNDNIVDFYPVSILQAATDGVWVEGLPETARIITVGQGFVEKGAEVEIRYKSAEANSTRQDDTDTDGEVEVEVTP